MNGQFFAKSCFTNEEKELLVKLVQVDRSIIESKRNDTAVINRKKRAWDIITQKFNTHPRTTARRPIQLRTLWKKLKFKDRSNSGVSSGNEDDEGNGIVDVMMMRAGQHNIQRLGHNSLRRELSSHLLSSIGLCRPATYTTSMPAPSIFMETDSKCTSFTDISSDDSLDSEISSAPEGVTKRSEKIHFNDSEKLMFLSILKPFLLVLECNYGAVALKDRKSVWTMITNSFNSHPEASTSRTVLQMKSLWKNLKSRLKRDLDAEKTSDMRSDERPAESSLDAISAEVHKLLKEFNSTNCTSVLGTISTLESRIHSESNSQDVDGPKAAQSGPAADCRRLPLAHSGNGCQDTPELFLGQDHAIDLSSRYSNAEILNLKQVTAVPDYQSLPVEATDDDWSSGHDSRSTSTCSGASSRRSKVLNGVPEGHCQLPLRVQGSPQMACPNVTMSSEPNHQLLPGGHPSRVSLLKNNLLPDSVPKLSYFQQHMLRMARKEHQQKMKLLKMKESLLEMKKRKLIQHFQVIEAEILSGNFKMKYS